MTLDSVTAALPLQPVTLTAVVSLCGLAFVMMQLRTRLRMQREAARDSRMSRSSPEKDVKPAASITPRQDFDWQSTEPNAFRPFKPIFHITMALQSDTPSDLITIDRDYLQRIELRKDLISRHGERVHGCHPSGQDAVQEMYQYLMQDYLPVRYPTIFKSSQGAQGSVLRNTITGDEFPSSPPEDCLAALRALGTTVEEDLFLLKPTDEGHQCVAFMCCFPSGWEPAEKLGRHMKQIHATVPGYEKIGPSMERFFGKLEAGKSVKRQNWTVQTHDQLYTGKGNHIHGDEEVQEEDMDVEKTFLRVELQTLSRLPKSHSILFSFKTYLYPIKDLKEEGLGPQLADAIEGLKKGNAPGMWRYKSAVRWGRSVCEYLRA